MQYTCKFCNRIFTKSSSLKNHQNTCLKNPELRYSEEPISFTNLGEIEYLNDCLPKVQRNQKLVYSCKECNCKVLRTFSNLKFYDFRMLCEKHLKIYTVQQRYGVTNVASAQVFKEKRMKTCKQVYGTSNPTQSKIVKSKLWSNRDRQAFSDKMKDVWNNKTGEQREKQRLACKCAMLSRSESEILASQEKAKQTCREKYGTDYWQCSKVYKTGLRERISKACKKYRYDNITFDSSWELALWIYAKDHSEEIEREPCQFEYEYNGAMHTYIPDFRYKGKLLEIKGDHYKDDKTKAKLLVAKDNDIQVLYQKDVQPYLDYMKQKEGRLWRLKYKNR